MSTTADDSTSRLSMAFDSLVEMDLQQQQTVEEDDFGDFEDAVIEGEEGEKGEKEGDDFGDFEDAEEEEEEKDDGFGNFEDAAPTNENFRKEDEEGDDFGNFEDAAPTDDKDEQEEDDFGDFEDADVVASTEQNEIENSQKANESHDDGFGNFGGIPMGPLSPPAKEGKEQEQVVSLPSPTQFNIGGEENVVSLPSPQHFNSGDFGDFENAAVAPSPSAPVTVAVGETEDLTQTEDVGGMFSLPSPDKLQLSDNGNDTKLQGEQPHRLSVFDTMVEMDGLSSSFNQPLPPLDQFGKANPLNESVVAVCNDFDFTKEDDDNGFGEFEGQAMGNSDMIQNASKEDDDDWGNFEAVSHPTLNDDKAVAVGATSVGGSLLEIPVNDEGFGDFTGMASTADKNENVVVIEELPASGFDTDWGDFEKVEVHAEKKEQQNGDFEAFSLNPPLPGKTMGANTATLEQPSSSGFDTDWGDFETVEHQIDFVDHDAVAKEQRGLPQESKESQPALFSEPVEEANDDFGDWGAFDQPTPTVAGGISNDAPSITTTAPNEEEFTLETLRGRLVQIKSAFPKEVQLKQRVPKKKTVKRKNKKEEEETSRILYLAKFDEGVGANLDPNGNSGKWLPMEEHLKIDPSGAKERLQKAVRCVSLHETLSSGEFIKIAARWEELMRIVNNELLTEYVRVVRSIVATIGDLLCLDTSVNLTKRNFKKDWGGIPLLESALNVEDSFQVIQSVAEKISKKGAMMVSLESIPEIRKRILQQLMNGSRMNISPLTTPDLFCHLTLQPIGSTDGDLSFSSDSTRNDTRVSVEWEGKPFMACAANFWCNRVSLSVP
eukprot:15367194-Ditylum_brightwellii.AAC.2